MHVEAHESWMWAFARGHYITHLRGINQYKSMLIFRDFPYYNLGGGFKYFSFSSRNLGKMNPF